MFKSFFTAALRNLRKNRLYTAINVLGLALGVACCLVIFVIVKFETSFDDYHNKADRIYRVTLQRETPHGREYHATTYSPLAETVRREVSGLEAVTGVYCLSKYQFSRDKNLFEDEFAFFADEDYFKVFDAKWIAGNQDKALATRNSAVVTDSFAEKFLGGISLALGSTFVVENKLTLTVSGIVQTPPPNTDHPYSILISYSSLSEFIPESVDNWSTIGGAATYVVLNPETEQGQINAQLTYISEKYVNDDAPTLSEFDLMALNDNHDRNYDYSSFNYDFPVPIMVILSIIAGMIAFIACVNYVNLATAQSLTRAREVGLRKTMGGTRIYLVVQYMCETFVITLLAVLTGVGIAQLGMLKLNELYGGNYLQFNLVSQPSTLLFLLGITVAISLLAGFYPAFVLSGYKPVLALRAQTSTGDSKGLSMRRALVILQFAGAQLLILVTIIIINQISYFRDRPIGYNPHTVVLLQNLRGNDHHEHDRLRDALHNVSGIVDFSFGNTGNERSQFFGEADQKHSAIVSYTDTSYIHTFEFDLLAGKNLIPDSTARQVIVNESLTKKLGMQNAASAVGTIITLGEREVIIRGVTEDTYTNTMSNTIDPVVMIYSPDRFAGVAINISTENISETISGIEQAWKEVYPEFLCKYAFMDDLLERQYGFYGIIFSVLGTGSFLAIFIGCLGLYGLVSFMAIQRTREIGIRKVLGATVANIMTLFTRESALLIAIAFVFAAPLAHLTGIAFLMEFPERVTPGMEVFVTTLFGSLFIALTTVAYRSFRAAVQSPVESLRSL